MHNHGKAAHGYRSIRRFANGLAFHPVAAQTVIKNFTVAVGTAPPCDLYVPAPSSVTGDIVVVQGTVSGAADPFLNIPALAGTSPYIALKGTPKAGGKAEMTFLLPKGTRNLNILWGTIDNIEGIVFSKKSGETTINGAELTKSGIATGASNV